MPCVHEFQLIDNIRTYSEEEHEFYKKGSALIDDDFLTDICNAGFGINELDTYWNNVYRPNKGLAWCGITLIPPRTLKELKEIVEEANKLYKSSELDDLLIIIRKAIKLNK